MSSSDKFILIGQTAVPCSDLMEWARWMETADRTVFKTRVGDWEVSTVFLGLDHNFQRQIAGHGEPLLFETMIFYRNDSWQRSMSLAERIEWQNAIESTLSRAHLELTYYQERYHDWADAEAGHEVAVSHAEHELALTRDPSRSISSSAPASDHQ